MMELVQSTSLTVALLLASSMSLAEGPKEWGAVGNWTINVNPETGNGCYMEQVFEDGLRVRFGYVPSRDGGFFAAYHKDWTDIVAGETGTIRFVFEDARFKGDIDLVSDGDWFGGFAFFDNPNLQQAFVKKNEMTVLAEDGVTMNVVLKGTSAAFVEVDRCQAAQE